MFADHLFLLLGWIVEQTGDLNRLLRGSRRSCSRRKRRAARCVRCTTSSRSSSSGGTSCSTGTIRGIRGITARRTRWAARGASRVAGYTTIALWTTVAWYGGHTRDLGATIPTTTHHVRWEAVRTTTSALRRVASSGREVHRRGTQVTVGDAGSGSLLHADLVALSNLVLELLATNVTALGKRDVQGLVTDHLVVHLSDRLGGLIRAGVADETKALRVTLLVAHDLGAGNGAERLKLSTELVVVHVVVDVFDIKVHGLPLGEFLHLGSLERTTELLLTLLLLLSTSDEKFLAIDLIVVEGLDGLCRLIVVFEVDETKALILAIVVGLDDSGGDSAECLKHLCELLVGDIGVNVLDIEIGVLRTNLLELGLPLLQQWLERLQR